MIKKIRKFILEKVLLRKYKRELYKKYKIKAQLNSAYGLIYSDIDSVKIR